MRNQNLNNQTAGRLQEIFVTPEVLIDLFVEMNFESQLNQVGMAQFKLVALQLGFSNGMIDQVMAIGVHEYTDLMK